MPKHDAEFWKKARHARNKLEKQYMQDPTLSDVTLIDIGYAPDQSEAIGEMVLRIHVNERWMQARPEDKTSFPTAVDGIPVVIVPGDQAVLE